MYKDKFMLLEHVNVRSFNHKCFNEVVANVCFKNAIVIAIG